MKTLKTVQFLFSFSFVIPFLWNGSLWIFVLCLLVRVFAAFTFTFVFLLYFHFFFFFRNRSVATFFFVFLLSMQRIFTFSKDNKSCWFDAGVFDFCYILYSKKTGTLFVFCITHSQCTLLLRIDCFLSPTRK